MPKEDIEKLSEAYQGLDNLLSERKNYIYALEAKWKAPLGKDDTFDMYKLIPFEGFSAKERSIMLNPDTNSGYFGYETDFNCKGIVIRGSRDGFVILHGHAGHDYFFFDENEAGPDVISRKYSTQFNVRGDDQSKPRKIEQLDMSKLCSPFNEKDHFPYFVKLLDRFTSKCLERFEQIKEPRDTTIDEEIKYLQVRTEALEAE